ncbi:MAG: hypothetical protein LC776_01805, partial [Acidobacteria bacterium]|nr:hypothetical protein [Acidobacteriota bacterium]
AQDLCIGVWSLTRRQARRTGTLLNPQGVRRDGFLLGILHPPDPSLPHRHVRLESSTIQVMVLSQLLQPPVVVLVLILPAATDEEHVVLAPRGDRIDLNRYRGQFCIECNLFSCDPAGSPCRS